MKKIVSILVFILLTLNSIGQAIPTNPEYYKNEGPKVDIDKFLGSKYLDEEFQSGIVEDKLSQKKVNTFIRYDVLNDFFEMKDTKASKNTTFLKKELGIDVVYNNLIFVYTNYYNELGNFETGYLQKLGVIGETEVFAKYTRSLKLPEKAKTTLEQDRKGRIRNEMYYLSESEGSKKVVNLDKKNILLYYSKENQPKIKSFIKKQKLKFKNPEDVVQLIAYAKTL